MVCIVLPFAPIGQEAIFFKKDRYWGWGDLFVFFSSSGHAETWNILPKSDTPREFLRYGLEKDIKFV